MKDLRKGRWWGRGTAIDEPGSVRFPEASLLAKDFQHSSQESAPKLINDWQSLNHSLADR